MRGLRFGLFLLGVPVMVLVSGCGSPYGPAFDTSGEGGSSTTNTGDGGSGGDIFTTSSTGDGGSGPVCEGECHLWKSALFEDLSMFWIGPGKAPPCPGNAPAPGVTLHADPQPSPMICPACSCASSGCALPEEMHVSAAKCPGIGAPSISWDSPAWEGACTSDGAIAPGLVCSGVPCTQSITIAAPSVEPCAAVSDGPEVKPDPGWGLTAQECILGPLSGDGCGGSEACAPSPSEGFSLCLYRWGDDLTPDQCPAEYPRYLATYADEDDTRACEPCSCAAPQGGECSALVSVFTDGGCSALLASYTITSAMDSACVDVPPGVGLGSKDATLTVSKPGSCAPSGGPVGGITPTLPLTLCCQPDPDPTP